MKSGVYKITCLKNNKLYIGSSKNILNRWKTHKFFLKNNKHINKFLQNAWNKYGEVNFLFEILEVCEESFLLLKEQYWMDLTNCYNRKIGFNACVKADRPLGYKHTKEDKKKMSNIKKDQYDKKLITSNFKHKKNFKHSFETIEKIKASKIGNKNPMYGKKEDQEHKVERMKNFLSAPKWNKGLTKETDERIKKLAVWKGKLPPNAIKHELLDKETNEIWKSDSLYHLSKICPLSLPTLNRLKQNKVGEKILNKYKLSW